VALTKAETEILAQTSTQFKHSWKWDNWLFKLANVHIVQFELFGMLECNKSLFCFEF